VQQSLRWWDWGNSHFDGESGVTVTYWWDWGNAHLDGETGVTVTYLAGLG